MLDGKVSAKLPPIVRSAAVACRRHSGAADPGLVTDTPARCEDAVAVLRTPQVQCANVRMVKFKLAPRSLQQYFVTPVRNPLFRQLSVDAIGHDSDE